VKYPLSTLGNVPVKVGDFYVLTNFIVLGMAKDTYTQIIRRGPVLATLGYKIDVKGGQLTFDVGKCHVEYSLFNDHNSSSSSFACEKDTFS